MAWYTHMDTKFHKTHPSKGSYFSENDNVPRASCSSKIFMYVCLYGIRYRLNPTYTGIYGFDLQECMVFS